MKKLNNNMKTIIALVFVMCGAFIFQGCSNTVTSPNDSFTTTYQRDGLIDSLRGDCSVVLTRAFLVDTLDFRNASKIKIELDAFTDADHSFVNFYYVDGTAVNVLALNGNQDISTKKSFIIDSPAIKKDFYIRIGLSASVCTGQIYNLSLRDLKISVQ
ncbi:hypothetical protein BH10BAC5_BH10BAC5_24650 [soil metagenome]